MFQLIVAVISIALIAALAIASIFYGGDAFTKSSEKANVTTLVNQAQQIAGAAALYKTENGVAIAAGVVNESSPLVPEFLAQAPQGNKVAPNNWEIVVDTAATPNVTYVYIPFDTSVDEAGKTSLCAEVAKQGAGHCATATGAEATDAASTTGFALKL